MLRGLNQLGKLTGQCFHTFYGNEEDVHFHRLQSRWELWFQRIIGASNLFDQPEAVVVSVSSAKNRTVVSDKHRNAECANQVVDRCVSRKCCFERSRE